MSQRIEQIGDAVLHLGDCREILPTLGKVDAVVTDPPYGVSGQQNTKTANLRGSRKNDYDGFSDSVDYVSAVAIPIIDMILARGIRAVVTPGNRCVTLYPTPDSFGVIFQPASVGLQPWGRADAQPILYYGKSPYGGKELPCQKCSYTLSEAAEPNGHPCPKPIKFWTSLVAGASRCGETVLDPFMGSGTTGVSCATLDRRFVGIEISTAYFDIACRRIEQAYKQPRLFKDEAPKPVQTSLLDAAE